MGRRLLFLGPPGAGKGTQAAMLAGALGVPHVSTGEILRRAVAEGTELGRRAEAIMAAGDLVPDDIVVAIVRERLAADDAACGYLLDGFPRTLNQAEALDAGGDAFEIVVLLSVPEAELLSRLAARAGGRADDNEETIRRRLEVYRKETEPLVTYYAARGVSPAEVDGVGTIEDVFARIVLALVKPA